MLNYNTIYFRFWWVQTSLKFLNIFWSRMLQANDFIAWVGIVVEYIGPILLWYKFKWPALSRYSWKSSSTSARRYPTEHKTAFVASTGWCPFTTGLTNQEVCKCISKPMDCDRKSSDWNPAEVLRSDSSRFLLMGSSKGKRLCRTPNHGENIIARIMAAF